jgi:stage II sporulation protein AA (anti-sigma F factor antagonist)
MSHRDPAAQAERRVPILKLTEHRLASGVIEIAVDGEVDLSVSEQLQLAIDGAGSAPVLIDLAGCTFLDSTGIAVFLRARRLREEDGDGRLVLHGPSPQVLRVLTVTGLTGKGLLYRDRDAALAALAA